MPFALGAQDPAVKHAALIEAVAKVLMAAPGQLRVEILAAALDADPTRRDYVGWILKQMKYGNIYLPEDGSRVREALATLEEAKRARYQGVEFDIHKYKTIGDLEAVTDRIVDAARGRERERPREVAELPAGVTLHTESEHYRILEVTGLDACIYLSRGTKWCTRESEPAKYYLKLYGKLYLILAQDGDQWVVYGQYTPDYSQIMDTKNKPLEVDEEVADLMAPNLYAPDAAERAYDYALNVLQGRWPEGEHLITRDPELAYSYVRDVIKGRWPQGEHVFREDPVWNCKYKDFLKSL